jgi:hypothetical protein
MGQADRHAGIGLPTATTLLSALFPGSHVIIDRRATKAAIGRGKRGRGLASIGLLAEYGLANSH